MYFNGDESPGKSVNGDFYNCQLKFNDEENNSFRNNVGE